MFINRNNYESFFLLYADNELRANERQAVEAFVAENEDLRIELNMLMATILPNDAVYFDDKNALLKTTSINETLQEQLLLKLDDALPANEHAALEQLIQKDVAVQQEWALLQQTKLDAADVIEFKNKAVLYRHEQGKLVIGKFLRYAAAAIFIGFGIFWGATWFNKPVDNTAAPTIATSNNNQKSQPTIVNNTNSTENNVNNTQPAVTKQNNAITVKNNNSSSNDSNNKKVVMPNNSDNGTLSNEPIIAVTPKTIVPVDIIPNKIDVPQQNIAIAAVGINKKVDDNNIVPLETAYTSTAVLNETESSENKILYLDEDDVKRSKVGGFFRKVKRFVERTAKVKTGNSIKIANFQITGN